MARYSEAPVVLRDVKQGTWVIIPIRLIGDIVIPDSSPSGNSDCLVRYRNSHYVHVSRADAGRAAIAKATVGRGSVWIDPRLDELFPVNQPN